MSAGYSRPFALNKTSMNEDMSWMTYSCRHNTQEFLVDLVLDVLMDGQAVEQEGQGRCCRLIASQQEQETVGYHLLL